MNKDINKLIKEVVNAICFIFNGLLGRIKFKMKKDLINPKFERSKLLISESSISWNWSQVPKGNNKIEPKTGTSKSNKSIINL